MHGVLVASHTAPTGLVVSGVCPTTIRSTLSPEIRPCAASPALVGLDWLSTRLILKRAFLPSTMMFLASSAFTTRSVMKVSAAVNGASGPVWGLTYPIRTSRVSPPPPPPPPPPALLPPPPDESDDFLQPGSASPTAPATDNSSTVRRSISLPLRRMTTPDRVDLMCGMRTKCWIPFCQYRRVLEGVNQVPATSVDGRFNGVSQIQGWAATTCRRRGTDSPRCI